MKAIKSYIEKMPNEALQIIIIKQWHATIYILLIQGHADMDRL